jgi:DNA-binding MarR family transcriptional regulator
VSTQTVEALIDPGTDAGLAARLRPAVARLARRMRNERGDADLSDPSFSVLAHLLSGGPTTPGRLADAEHVQPPTMTRTVNCLVELGLVTKRENPDDGRQVVVHLTEAGVAEVHETRRRRDAWLTSRLAALTPDERAQLAGSVELLARLAAG